MRSLASKLSLIPQSPTATCDDTKRTLSLYQAAFDVAGAADRVYTTAYLPKLPFTRVYTLAVTNGLYSRLLPLLSTVVPIIESFSRWVDREPFSSVPSKKKDVKEASPLIPFSC